MVKSGSGGSSHTPLFNNNNKMVITREINKSKLPSPSLIHLLGIYFKGVSFHFLGPHHTLGGRLHLHAGWLVGVGGLALRGTHTDFVVGVRHLLALFTPTPCDDDGTL